MTSVGRHRQQPDVGHRRRRRTARRIATGTVVTLAAATVLVSGDWSQAASAEQVLQSVQVSVGPDGSLTQISGNDIVKQAGGSKTTSTTYAPQDVASKLPIRVSLSYLKDGVPGTDLSKLKGTKGLVEVDVTVTNATVQSRQVSYKSGGQTITQQSLVGTPLTVTGSVTLPKGSFAQIVMPTTATPGAHTTNGAVSASSDGTTVSWAALLAPPQLSPTTTFTLVEQADKFQLPKLSLSAQAGYVADPSITSLITRTFASDSSAVATQDQAIDLVTQINSQLSAVSQTLGTIRDNLDGTATDLATSADATLDSASEQIQGAAASLAGELDSLQDSISGSVSSSNDTASQALTTTVQQLVSYLGVPAGTTASPKDVFARSLDQAAAIAKAADPTTTTTTPGTCGSSVGTVTPAKTVYAQLVQVASLTHQISANGGACITDEKADLLKVLGADPQTTVNGTAYCDVTDKSGTKVNAGTLSCSLLASQNDIAAKVATLSTSLLDVPGEIDQDVTQAKALVSQALTDLQYSTLQAQQALLTVKGVPGSVVSADPFAAGSSELATLQSARSALDTAVSAVAAQQKAAADLATTLNNLASSSYLAAVSGYVGGIKSDVDSTLGAPPTSTSVLSKTDVRNQIAVAAGFACQADSTPGDLINADIADYLLTGATCDNKAIGDVLGTLITLLPYSASVDSRLGTLESDTDTAATNAASSLASLSSSISDAGTAAQHIADTLKTYAQQNGSGVSGSLATAVSAIDDLLGTNGSSTKVGDGSKAAALESALGALGDQIGALVPTDTSTASCPTKVSDTPTDGTIADVTDCYAGLQTMIDALVNGTISGADGATPQLDTLVQTLKSNGQTDSTEIGTEATTAGSGLDGLLGQLQKQLDDTADAELAQGTSSLATETATLQSTLGSTTKTLSSSTAQALAALHAAVDTANTAQNQVSSTLANEIALAKVNIGGSGGGILGTVQDSVGQAAGGSTRVDSAAAQASGFKGVRIAEVDQALLEAAQASLASQLADQFPYFGGTLPQGSTFNTVYVFQLAAIG